MKSSTVFPSAYLKSADLGQTKPLVTISHVTMDKFEDETKAVLHFSGKDRGLVLNKTNWSMLELLTGQDDSDAWVGFQVQLTVQPVPFQGKVVPAIRIQAPPVRLAPPPPVPSVTTSGDADSDVPF